MSETKADYQTVTTHLIRDSDIVPDDYQNALLYWRDTFSRGYFAIGDIANELCELSLLKNFPVTQQRVFDAVGRFCGKSGRTVRYYAETASFYDDDVRNEYDMLPFSHFVFARTLGDKWSSVLDFAKLSPHCSVEYLRKSFCFGEDESMCAQKTVCYDQADEFTPPKITESEKFLANTIKKNTRSGWLADLSDLVDRLSSVIEWEDRLDSNTKNELSSCLATLRKSIPIVAKALATDDKRV